MAKIFKAKAISAYEAIAEAQKLAFAPIVFQAVRALRDLGILATIEAAGASGSTVDTIAEELALPEYGVRVLLESGLSVGVVLSVAEGRFAISKVGHFLLHDRMTRVNMDFSHFVCYRGLYNLDKAVVEGRPAGLRTIDERHSTFYEALPNLPDDIKNSWYAFDHFYSDAAYPDALKIVLSRHPETLVDIGANRGRFSILAALSDRSLRVSMIDLPDQLAEAVSLVDDAGLSDRIEGISMDMRLADSLAPRGQDAYWVSQFLCCFSESEVVALLQRIATAMERKSRLYVLETCWDRQQHETASFALVNTSPYFTCIANGSSKMYTADELLDCINRSGLQCEQITDGLGSYHTLFECSKVAATASR